MSNDYYHSLNMVLHLLLSIDPNLISRKRIFLHIVFNIIIISCYNILVNLKFLLILWGLLIFLSVQKPVFLHNIFVPTQISFLVESPVIYSPANNSFYPINDRIRSWIDPPWTLRRQKVRNSETLLKHNKALHSLRFYNSVSE